VISTIVSGYLLQAVPSEVYSPLGARSCRQAGSASATERWNHRPALSLLPG